MAAATVTDDSVRDAMIGLVYAYASADQNNSGNNPLAVVYNAATSEEMLGAGGGGGINRFVASFTHFETFSQYGHWSHVKFSFESALRKVHFLHP